MKHIYYIILLVCCILISGCSNDESEVNPGENKQAIGFHTDSETRAGNAETAPLLGKKFIVFGQKTAGNNVTNVFGTAGYQVEYENNEWTYENVDGQELQYFDYAFDSYTFSAYSLGKGDDSANPTEYASISEASLSGLKVTGTPKQLMACYIADRKVVARDSYNQTVQLTFNQLASRVRIGFFESIPGYVVKEIKFYASSTATQTGTDAVLFTETENGTFPTESANYSISYDEDGKVVATLNSCTSKSSSLALGALNTYTTIATGNNNYTFTDYLYVLPQSLEANLKLKIDYTLKNESSSDTEYVTGVVATIPVANNPAWKCNRSYTYIFELTKSGIRISDEWDNDYRH